MTRAEVLRACAVKLRAIAVRMDVPEGGTEPDTRELRTCAHDLANVLTVLRGEED